MKNLARLLCVVALAVLGLLAGGARDAADSVAPRITWDGDLATITWDEALADPAAGPDETPFSILTGPCLGWLTDSSAVIGWEVVAAKSLTSSPYASLPADFDLERMRFRSATLSGLKSDTAYRYRLVSGRGKQAYLGKEYRFRTPPPADSKKLRFAVIGDTQNFASQPWTDINRKLYADINAWDAPLLLHVGDIVFTGWGPGINGRKEWFRVFDLMRELRATRWLAPAMGNHDVKVGQLNWAPDYFRDLPPQRNAARPAQPPFYYSFDMANVHFVALSTEQRRTTADAKVYDRFTWQDQLAWLEEDLRQSKAPWKMAYFHQPLHTAGGNACPPEFRDDFGKLFDKNQVPILFSGHDHSYQRSLRIQNGSRELADNGTVQVISGGASNQFERRSSPPWSVLHVKLYHYLRVNIADDEMRVECITDEGSLYEAWKMKLAGQPERLSGPAKS